jgi:hypothetical protein
MREPRVKRPALTTFVPAAMGTATRWATLASAAAAVGATVYLAVGRERLLRWGATDAETMENLPGDGYLPDDAMLASTRATTVPGSPTSVWSHLFPDPAGPAVGDRFALPLPARIRPMDALSLLTVAVAPGSHLVLATWDPATERAESRLVRGEWSATWAVVLRDRDDGSTRITTRFRAAHPGQPDAPAVGALAIEPLVFVLERRILGRLGRTVTPTSTR